MIFGHVQRGGGQDAVWMFLRDCLHDDGVPDKGAPAIMGHAQRSKHTGNGCVSSTKHQAPSTRPS
jgi:hypothetical protein